MLILDGLFVVKAKEHNMETIIKQMVDFDAKASSNNENTNSNFNNIAYEEMKSLLIAIDKNYNKTLEGLQNV